MHLLAHPAQTLVSLLRFEVDWVLFILAGIVLLLDRFGCLCFFDFADEVIELRHRFIFTVFRMLHLVDESLALECQRSEPHLNVEIGLINVAA
jgi:hypothetical protein